MTNNITMPRAVVEQALEAVTAAIGAGPYKNRCSDAAEAIRAALEQPVTGNPVSVPTGWKLVPVEPTIHMLHRADGLTCIDFAALGREGAFDLDELKEIYRAMLAAAPQPPVLERPNVDPCKDGSCDCCWTDKPQPQGEQEPVAWIEISEGALSYNPYYAAARELQDGVRFDLYTRPQPKRESLTNEQINRMWHDYAKGVATSRTLPFEWYLLGIRHAEHANNIK